MWLQPKLNPGTLMMHHVSFSTNTPQLTMSLGCMMMTCHTVAFVLSLLALSCLVLLHHSPHSFLFHVSSEVGSARRDTRKLWQVVCSSSVVLVATVHYVWPCLQDWILPCLLACRELANYCIILYSMCISQQMMNACTLSTTCEHDKACVWPLYGTFTRQRILISCMKVTKWRPRLSAPYTQAQET